MRGLVVLGLAVLGLLALAPALHADYEDHADDCPVCKGLDRQTALVGDESPVVGADQITRAADDLDGGGPTSPDLRGPRGRAPPTPVIG